MVGRNPVLNLVDCVLSLNRDYDEFAKPRVNEFRKTHREVITLRDLRNLICSTGGPVQFFRKELDYRDARRAKVFGDVLDRLIDIAEESSGTNELRRLSRWAHSISPKGYRDFGVFGFGLAGFQYLRMLFGVDTVKPDRYIRDFVKDCLGKAVSDMRALYLVETAAKSIGYSPREVDRVIWEDYARNRPDKRQKHKHRC